MMYVCSTAKSHVSLPDLKRRQLRRSHAKPARNMITKQGAASSPRGRPTCDFQLQQQTNEWSCPKRECAAVLQSRSLAAPPLQCFLSSSFSPGFSFMKTTAALFVKRDPVCEREWEYLLLGFWRRRHCYALLFAVLLVLVKAGP